MAKKSGGGGRKASPRTFTTIVDPRKTKGYADRIETLLADLESLKGEYMAECKSLREDVKSVLEEAKAAGIDPKALKAVVDTRAAEKRAERIRLGLKTETQEVFDAIRVALGDYADTPLGEAALRREGGPGASALDDLAKGAGAERAPETPTH